MNKKTKMSMTMVTVMILTTTPLLCMLSNSWLMVWMMLEFNTMTFCSILKLSKKKNKKAAESSMKYFIIQSISSTMFLMMMMNTKEIMNLNIVCMSMALLSVSIKMAAAPFHQWMISMTKTLDMTMATMLMTYQKAAPLYLVIFQSKYLIPLIIVISASVGSTSQMNKNNVMEIMAISSVFNLSWMLLALLLSTKVTVLFCLIYWNSVITIMYLVNKINLKTTQSSNFTKNNKVIIMMMITNLAGLPPFSNFLSKWMILTEGIKKTMKLMPLMIMITSAVNFFVYLRMSTKELTFMKEGGPFKKPKIKKTVMVFFMLSNSIPTMMLTLLGNALNKKGLFW